MAVRSRHTALVVGRLLEVMPPGASCAVDRYGITPLERFLDRWVAGVNDLVARFEGEVVPNGRSGGRRRAILRKDMGVYDPWCDDYFTTCGDVCEVLFLLLRATDAVSVGDSKGCAERRLRRRQKNQFLPLHTLLMSDVEKQFLYPFVRFLLMLYPHYAFEKDKDGNLPLHIVVTTTMSQDDCDSKEGIISTIKHIIKTNPDAALIPNYSKKRFPLTLFVLNMNFGYRRTTRSPQMTTFAIIIMELLLDAAPQCLYIRDVTTSLLPFMLASVVAEKCNNSPVSSSLITKQQHYQINSVYWLLRRDPSVMSWRSTICSSLQDLHI